MAKVVFTVEVEETEIPTVFAHFRSLVRTLELPAYKIEVETDEKEGNIS